MFVFTQYLNIFILQKKTSLNAKHVQKWKKTNGKSLIDGDDDGDV